MKKFAKIKGTKGEESMNLDKIKEILDEINIDERIKLIIIAYFKGKIETKNLDEKTVKIQLKDLCNRIKNVEFIDYPNVGVAYERRDSILSINKRIAKFEEALDTKDYGREDVLKKEYYGDKGFSRHIYYFLNGVELTQKVRTTYFR